MAAVPSTRRAAGVEHPVVDDGAEGLYARHSESLLRFCLYQLGRRDDAEEAVQTTFLHALGALRRGVVPRSEEAWLVHIARNVCRTRWSAGRRRLEVEQARDPQVLAELAGGLQPEPLDLPALRRALAALPEQQRRAVLLREWQGLSYREIAAELETSVPAVETMIYRARAALADALAEQPRRARRQSLDVAGALTWLKSLLGGGATAAKIAAGVALTAAAGGVAAEHAAHAPRTGDRRERSGELRPAPAPARAASEHRPGDVSLIHAHAGGRRPRASARRGALRSTLPGAAAAAPHAPATRSDRPAAEPPSPATSPDDAAPSTSEPAAPPPATAPAPSPSPQAPAAQPPPPAPPPADHPATPSAPAPAPPDVDAPSLPSVTPPPVAVPPPPVVPPAPAVPAPPVTVPTLPLPPPPLPKVGLP